jgi:hypothetical protein
MGVTVTTEEYKAFAAEVRQAEQEAKAAQERYLALNEKLASMRGSLTQTERESVPVTGPAPN